MFRASVKGMQVPRPCPAPSPPGVLLQVHAYIISYLKKEMPSVFGKENKKKQLILKLPVIFAKIQLEHHISPGDFPDCQKMQVCVAGATPHRVAGSPVGFQEGAWKAGGSSGISVQGKPGFMS